MSWVSSKNLCQTSQWGRDDPRIAPPLQVFVLDISKELKKNLPVTYPTLTPPFFLSLYTQYLICTEKTMIIYDRFVLFFLFCIFFVFNMQPFKGEPLKRPLLQPLFHPAPITIINFEISKTREKKAIIAVIRNVRLSEC